MENQPKLNSSKEVIAFLAERFPLCFTTEGETRPLKIGIFQDLVERVPESDNVSKTQLRSALRLYTSSWRYLYGVKLGAQRVDLDGNPCGELEQQHVDHARTQLEEAKARVQAQRAEQQAKKREAAGESADAARTLVLLRNVRRVAMVQTIHLEATRLKPMHRANLVSLLPVNRSPLLSNQPMLNSVRKNLPAMSVSGLRLRMFPNCKSVRKSKSEPAKTPWMPPCLKLPKAKSEYNWLLDWQ